MLRTLASTFAHWSRDPSGAAVALAFALGPRLGRGSRRPRMDLSLQLSRVARFPESSPKPLRRSPRAALPAA